MSDVPETDTFVVTPHQFILGQCLNTVPQIILLVGGFFLLEAGSVRSKNATSILMKNIINMSIGITAFWLIGGGILLGDTSAGGIFGTQAEVYALAGGFSLGETTLTAWMVLVFFGLTSTTIPSGAFAERSTMEMYAWYTWWTNLIFFPLVAHWSWNKNGWLFQWGFHDTAGSSVVHGYGAFTSLAGCYLLGPRLEHVDVNGKWIRKPPTLVGHSVLMQVLGTVMLTGGFFAFNGASVLLTHLNLPLAYEHFSIAMINTAMAASGGGVCGTLVAIIVYKNYNIMDMNMSMLAGCVSSCAGCMYYDVYGSFIIGVLAALMYFYTRFLVNFYHIDDPLDAIALHGGAGFVGVMSVAFFANDAQEGVVGLFYGGGGSLIYKQLVGWFAICGVAFVAGLLIFLVPYKMGWLRVSHEHEVEGLDMACFSCAYPEVQAKGDFIKFREFLASQEMYEDYDRHRGAFLDWMAQGNSTENESNMTIQESCEKSPMSFSHAPLASGSGVDMIDDNNSSDSTVPSTVHLT